MDVRAPRSCSQRRADAIAKLEVHQADAWVASASAAGDAHLVPPSLAWDGERVILATTPRSVTAQNILRSGTARLALGGTRDVVLIDAVLDESVLAEAASSELAECFARQSDWDPRSTSQAHLFLVLRLRRIQTWREENEIADRVVMRDGDWLT